MQHSEANAALLARAATIAAAATNANKTGFPATTCDARDARSPLAALFLPPRRQK